MPWSPTRSSSKPKRRGTPLYIDWLRSVSIKGIRVLGLRLIEVLDSQRRKSIWPMEYWVVRSLPSLELWHKLEDWNPWPLPKDNWLERMLRNLLRLKLRVSVNSQNRLSVRSCRSRVLYIRRLQQLIPCIQVKAIPYLSVQRLQERSMKMCIRITILPRVSMGRHMLINNMLYRQSECRNEVNE